MDVKTAKLINWWNITGFCKNSAFAYLYFTFAYKLIVIIEKQ